MHFFLLQLHNSNLWPQSNIFVFLTTLTTIIIIMSLVRRVLNDLLGCRFTIFGYLNVHDIARMKQLNHDYKQYTMWPSIWKEKRIVYPIITNICYWHSSRDWNSYPVREDSYLSTLRLGLHAITCGHPHHMSVWAVTLEFTGKGFRYTLRVLPHTCKFSSILEYRFGMDVYERNEKELNNRNRMKSLLKMMGVVGPPIPDMDLKVLLKDYNDPLLLPQSSQLLHVIQPFIGPLNDADDWYQ